MSMLKRTRSTPKGYTKPGYYCADCGRLTKAVQKVWGTGLDGQGNQNVTLVCRNGTGCHKDTDANRPWSAA